MSCAAPSDSLPSTSRSSETESRPPDVVHGDVMHGERAVARDHHHALQHGLVVERARLGRRRRPRRRGISARIACGDAVLDRRDAVERQRAADRHDRDRRTACRRPAARARRSTATTPGTRAATRRMRFGGARRRGVGQRLDGAAAEPPAGDADEHRDDDRRRRVRPRIAERDAAEPDQHRDRRPHVGAEMQRVGLQRLARGLAGDAIEQAGAEEIDHDRDDDHGEGRDASPRPRGLRRRAAASPPPRSPRRTARTAARSRPAPRRSRPCRGRSDAPRRPACRRCARRNRSSPWRRNRSANARPPTGSRASR